MYAIIVLIVLAPAYYFYAPEDMKFWKSDTATVTPPMNEPADSVKPMDERITAKHQFKNGTHIIAGELNQPTPCYVLSTDARVAESYPEQVTIAFTSKTSGDICAQVITADRFKVEFAASENAVIKATWNGNPVELNLIPAGANENLDNFDVFIKG